MRNKLKLLGLAILLSCAHITDIKAAIYNVDTINDVIDACNTSDGGVTFNCTSLRDAIMAVNASPAGDDTINLSAGTYGITLGIVGELVDQTLDSESDFDITKSNGAVTIIGAGADQTFVSGSSENRVFHIQGPDANVSFQDLTVSHGMIHFIDDGVTGRGAGILAEDTILNINNCEIVNSVNEEGPGGGVYAAGTSLTVNNSAVLNNSAEAGGGFSFGGLISSNIINTTISGNSATQIGGAGGIFSADENLTISYSTITNNSAQGMGGLSGFSTKIANSIVAGNNPDAANKLNADISINVVSLGHNIFGITGEDEGQVDEFFNIDKATDQYGLTTSPVDPMLADLEYNGASTRTHALLPDSPAIDAGDPMDCMSGDLDQREKGRPVGDGCDIGAFELQAICGNEVTEEGEACDLGVDNGLPESDCSTTCQTKTPGTADLKCGNGVLDTPEECDDGNNIDDDLCSSLCLNVATNPPGNEGSGGCAISTSTSFNYFYLAVISLILGWVIVRPRIVKQHGGNETRQ